MQILDTESYSFRTLVKHWLYALGGLLVLAFVLYQARFLIVGPQIVLRDSPSGPQNVRELALTGTAYNISHLWLNDRPIYTDAKGNFNESIVLENGYSVATLRAIDRYGRSTIVAQDLVYEPASLIQ